MPLINQAGGVAIGVPIGSGTSGSVLFIDVTGKLAQDNTNFKFNDTTNSLTLGGNLLFVTDDVSTIGVTGTRPNKIWAGTGGITTSGTVDVISATTGLINLQANSGYAGFTFTSYRNSAITHGLFEGQAARGSLASPLAISSGDSLFRISATGWDGSTFYTTGGDVSAQINFKAEENFTSGLNHAGGISFETTASGANFRVEHLRITSNGVVTYLKAGAASLPAALFTGAPYAAGTATTNFPLMYFNTTGASAPSSFSTAGTYLGFNSASGFNGSFLSCHINGAAPFFYVSGSSNRLHLTNGIEFGTGLNTTAISLHGTGILISADGVIGPKFISTGFRMVSTHAVQWSDGTSYAGTSDLFLYRDAANTLAQRNGTSSQVFNIYETYTDASNYSRMVVGYSSNLTGFRVGTDALGTGTKRILYIGADSASETASSIQFRMGGSLGNIWHYNTSGHYMCSVDNTYDIGATGATRPRSIYSGTSFIGPVGGVGTPSYTFTGDTDTGIWSAVADGISFSCGGGEKFRVQASVIYSFNAHTMYGVVSFIGAGAASTAIINPIAAIYAAGTGTTTFPYHYHNVSGATAVTTFSTAGTFMGFNAASGFTGNFVDYNVNGSRVIQCTYQGDFKIFTGTSGRGISLLSAAGDITYWSLTLNGGLQLSNSNPSIQWYSGGVTGTADTVLLREAAGTLAQRSGTTAQKWNIYTTYTDASNYFGGQITCSASMVQIKTNMAGTGSDTSCQLWLNSDGYTVYNCGSSVYHAFRVGGTDKMRLESTQLLPHATNTITFGGSSNRWTAGYFGTGGIDTTGPYSTSGQIASSYAGAASTAVVYLTGALLTGGTTTTNFPQYFAQPSGATAVTTWSTAGTFIGINAASGFTGNFLDFRANGGAAIFTVSSTTFTSALQHAFSSQTVYSYAGAASLCPIIFTGTLYAAGTGTTNFPQIFQQPTGTTAVTTWSTAGTWYGINAASGFAGNFIDVHAAGGTSLFKVDSIGTGYFGITTDYTKIGGTGGSGSLVSGYLSGALQSSLQLTGTCILSSAISGNFVRLAVTSTGAIQLMQGTNSVYLNVPTADILEQRNSSTAQEFRLSGGYTDASNYQRLAMRYASTYFYLIPEKLGTGVCSGLIVGASTGSQLLFLDSGDTTYMRVAGTATIYHQSTHFSPATGGAITLGNVSAAWGRTYTTGATISGAGAASTPAIYVTGAVYTGGTATTTFPQLYMNDGDVAVTGFSTGGSYVGINMPTTATANGTNGRMFIDCFYGGSTTRRFRVRADGSVFAANSYNLSEGDNVAGMSLHGTGVLVAADSTWPLKFTSTGPRLKSDVSLNWTDGTAYVGTVDLSLWRDAANTLALRNSTNSQEFRLYGTYTNGSNYSLLALRKSGGYWFAIPEIAGTGTQSGMILGANTTNFEMYIDCNTTTIFRIGGSNMLTLAATSFTANSGVSLGTTGTRWTTGYFGSGGVNSTGQITTSVAGAASTPGVSLTGSIFTGGSATTTFPYHLHSVTGSTAVTSWSTNGTFIGLNSASGFTGNFLDFNLNGTNVFVLRGTGVATFTAGGATTTIGAATLTSDNGSWTIGTANTKLIFGSNTLEQYNSTTAQAFQIYNTRTDASNYERGSIYWSGNIFNIQMMIAGTGTGRSIAIAAGTSGFTIGYNGQIDMNGTLCTYSGNVRLPISNYLYWNNASNIRSTVDGSLTITNFADTGFTRLLLGPSGANYVGLGPTGANGILEVKTANGSSYSGIVTGSYTANANGAASTSPLSLTGTIFTGGSGTTTFPYHYHNVTGATAVTSFSTSGTFYGINAASGFAGNLVHFCANGSGVFSITSAGNINVINNTGWIGFGASAPDVFLKRISSTGLEVNTSVTGTTRDLKLRDLVSTGNIGAGKTPVTSWVEVAAGTTAKAQINLASSTAPSSPTDGDVWYDGVDVKLRVGSVTTALNAVTSINFGFDGGGVALAAGKQIDIVIPYACTINNVTLLADVSGSCVLDIWVDTYANYPPTIADTIVAAAKPTISSATKSQDTTLTGWTTSIAAGSTMRINIDSASTITRLTGSLKVTKT